MKLATYTIGLAGITLLASLAVSSPALAESNQMWCEFNGGTWNGVNGDSISKGICSFPMVASDPGPVARARSRVACTNVGGTVSEIGGKLICAVSSANVARVKASAEFRSLTSKR